MQAVCGDKCVDVSTVRCWVWQFKQEELGEASLFNSAMLGRPVTATDKKIIKSNRRTLLLCWESLKKEWTTLSAFLDSEILCQLGTMKSD